MSDKLSVKFSFDKKDSAIVILTSSVLVSSFYAVVSHFKHKRQLKHKFEEGYFAGYNDGLYDSNNELS